MPHTRTAKKRLRQNKKLCSKNRDLKKDIKIQVKKLLRALEAGDQAAAKKELSACEQRLDKAGAKNVLHKNKAARKKSQLAKMVNAKAAGSAESK